MTENPALDRLADALNAASLLAVDPAGLGGVSLRGRAGSARDGWIAAFRALLPEAPILRVPCGVGEEQLLGGLDLSATLAAGRPVAERGLLQRANGGVLIAAMAERMGGTAAALIGHALDDGEVMAERDGLSLRAPARLGVIACDEGLDADEFAPPALTERLAFRVELDALPAVGFAPEAGFDPDEIADARRRLAGVTTPDEVIAALTAAAAAMGIVSCRAPVLALRAARASAALHGREMTDAEDAALAARLVLGHRALHLPAPPAEDDEATPPEPDAPDDNASPPDPEDVKKLDDVVLDAALAAIPTDLLAQIKAGSQGRQRGGDAGKAGDSRQALKRGRPIGARRGAPRQGVRLDLLATLRAAAPWQRLRRAMRRADGPRPLIEVRRDDFHIRRFREHRQTTTIFVVDASGSTALERLAEAKGAVELLLADCYIRRDEVALVSFRGVGAELLLPPTRSLARAKRELAAMPGGGGTPLAAGLLAAGMLAGEVSRKGRTPTLVLITDGRANVTRAGEGGRAQAQAEAESAASALRARHLRAVLVDNSARPEPKARALAGAMGALYLALPRASAGTISAAVRAQASLEAAGGRR